MDDETPVGTQWRTGVKELEPISSSLQSHKLKQEGEDWIARLCVFFFLYTFENLRI